jgi:hypothetical protein
MNTHTEHYAGDDKKISNWIRGAAEALGFQLGDIIVIHPMTIDDFDPNHYKVAWSSKVMNLHGIPDVGSRLSWPQRPNDADLRMSMRRSASFVLLVGMLPEGKHIYEAMRAHSFDESNLLIGAYKMTMVALLAESIKWPSMEEIEKGVVPVMPRLAPTVKKLNEYIATNTKDFIKKTYANMKDDLKRDRL